MTDECDKLKPSRSAAKEGERIDGLGTAVGTDTGLTAENKQ